jgi:hypothetical protein
MAKIFFCTIILLMFAGCMGLAMKENFFGNYYLVATDKIEDLSLCYHANSDGDIYGDIIQATVFAIGYNEKYIIAKQHPRTFPHPPNKAITNYFILPLKQGMDWKTKNGLIGPLSLEQFNEKRKQLNIPDSLKFTIEKKSLQ